jgi:hypothetical protein
METDMAELNTTDTSSDSALFQELTQPGATPEPKTPEPPPPPPAPGQPPQGEPGQPAQPQPTEGEPNIPSARLREEADARRAAERRSEALQMQVEALLQRFQPQQPPPQKPRTDIFENPSGFVQEEMGALIEPLNQQLMQVREFYSKRDAVREFGAEKVGAAFAAIESGLRNRDPETNLTYMRIMRSLDPYGDMVRWHQQKETFTQIGGDLSAYNQRILQQAMQDPNFQAQVLAAARGQAPPVAMPAGQPRMPNGQFAPAQQSSLPSIARVGATALSPVAQDDVSDAQLFAETTSRSAKRPPS